MGIYIISQKMKRFRFFLLVAFYALLTGGVAIAAPDPNFYVFLCFGQSNMEGHSWVSKLYEKGNPDMKEYYENGFENTFIA